MKAHQIENGVVVNTIEVESLDFMPNLIEAAEGGIGWLWDGTDFSEPPAQAPSPEQLREAAKAARQAAVEAITVTTAAGNTFDGDEVSQSRMSRAILVLSTGFATTVPWVLADNSVIQATADELTEALALAGQAQAALWVIS